MNTEKLNRKERRLLQFGSQRCTDPEIAASREYARDKLLHALQLKEQAKVRVIRPGDKIVIPVVEGYTDRQWTLPYNEIPEKYRRVTISYDLPTKGTATKCEEYMALVLQWFYTGLEEFSPSYRQPVVNADAFIPYLGFVLSSMTPSHEQKMAYATYIIDVCCESVYWELKCLT